MPYVSRSTSSTEVLCHCVQKSSSGSDDSDFSLTCAAVSSSRAEDVRCFLAITPPSIAHPPHLLVHRLPPLVEVRWDVRSSPMPPAPRCTTSTTERGPSGIGSIPDIVVPEVCEEAR